MVVSGSRMEQKLEDVSGPIAVITSEQIEEQVVSNVADLFRYEPGVSVQGGAGDAQTFTIRGMSENRVKVVQDGVRQNDAYKNGGVGQTYFDTDMIKQVEVAKGPASAAYGSDALGGVIAITTKDAGDFLKGRDSYLDATTGYASSSHQRMAGITGRCAPGKSRTCCATPGAMAVSPRIMTATRTSSTSSARPCCSRASGISPMISS